MPHAGHITTLDTWLEVATRGLRDKSRERIREEMTAHYDAALDDALRNGASEDRARSSALASMGDPQEARQRFKQEHFTAAEAFTYLGEHSERHRRAYFRQLCFSVVLPMFVGSFASRLILFKSGDSGTLIDSIAGLTSGLVGNALGAAVILLVVRISMDFDVWPESSAKFWKAKLPKLTRWSQVLLQVGAVASMCGVLLLLWAIFTSTAFASTTGLLGERWAVATGATLLSSIVSAFGWSSAREFTRIQRLLQNESDLDAAHD